MTRTISRGHAGRYRQDQAFSRPFRLNKQSSQAKGLVGWWPLCDAEQYNNYAKTSRAGVPNSVDWVNTPTRAYVPDFDKDGTTEIVTANSDPLDFTTSYTLCFWVYVKSYGSDFTMFMCRGEGDTDDIEFYLDTTADRKWVLVHNRGNGGVLEALVEAGASSPSVSTGTWHHIAASYISEDTNVYLDGIIDATSADIANALLATDRPWRFGHSEHTAATFNDFDGYMSDVRMYNRVLSASEVYQLYAPSTRWDLYEPIPRVFPVGLLTAGPSVIGPFPTSFTTSP